MQKNHFKDICRTGGNPCLKYAQNKIGPPEITLYPEHKRQKRFLYPIIIIAIFHIEKHRLYF